MTIDNPLLALQQVLTHWKRMGIKQTRAASGVWANSWSEAESESLSNHATSGRSLQDMERPRATASSQTISASKPSVVSAVTPPSHSMANSPALASGALTQPSAATTTKSSSDRLTIVSAKSVLTWHDTNPVLKSQFGIDFEDAPDALLIQDQRSRQLQVIDQQVRQCTRCPELVRSRSQTVFGVGNVRPRVVFFGEAPGAEEDRVGEPFVGPAGKLLDRIIVASQMKREEVYILNSIKCRPANNRTPVDSEIENCRCYFEGQLEILRPEYIVCLGAVAVRALLRVTDPVGRLRGKFYAYRGAKVMVTYHPAYLLRTEEAKKLTWDDMQMLMAAMGLTLPKSKA